MGTWERLKMSIAAGIETWRGGASLLDPQGNSQDAWDRQYRLLWSIHTGDAFSAVWREAKLGTKLGTMNPLYSDTRMVFSHAQSVNGFYEMHTYLGALPVDGQRLPDGSRGAIPLDPQTGKDELNRRLFVGTGGLWRRWNWQQGMSQRPLYGAALGIAFTELIDDTRRHMAWPKLIWPGRLASYELDMVDNVKAYALEYMVTREIDGKEKTFRYRKEVDKEAYRYYMDDQPWDDPDGHGEAEQPNPYGFVPAILDQHRKVNGPRGLPAITGTRQSLEELNSLLSHSIDHQHKHFGAPIGVVGADHIPEGVDDGPEWLNFIPLGENGALQTLELDIGQTLAIVEWLKDGITETNPEARFYQELRSMSSLTGPAVERALGDVTMRINQARKGYDTQSVKLFQMALAICGFRLNTGAWEGPIRDRDRVFEPFTLESYQNGELDMVILPRGVVPETEEERIRLEILKDQIETVTGLMALGLTKPEAEARLQDRDQRRLLADGGAVA